MAIRPVDMQLTVPKTAEYSQQHQGEINKQHAAQMAFTQASTKEAERQHTAVIETNESERSVNKDGGNKQEQQRRNRKKKPGEKDGEKEKDNTGTGLFDVRI